jgi:hypothetical protein
MLENQNNEKDFTPHRRLMSANPIIELSPGSGVAMSTISLSKRACFDLGVTSPKGRAISFWLWTLPTNRTKNKLINSKF